MANTETKTPRTDIFWIRPDQLYAIPDENKRFVYPDIPELAASIKSNGVETPLVVQKDKGAELYRVIGGFRRERAIRLLEEDGYTEFVIPVIKEKKDTTDVQRALNLYIHNDGKPFTMIEKAHIFKDLIDNHGLKQKDVARMLGVSATHVGDCLKLTEIPEKLQQQIIKGKMSATLVVEQMKKGGAPEDVAQEMEVAADATEGKVTKGKTSAGAKDKKITITSIEDLYTAVEHEAGGATKVRPEKMEVLSTLTKYLRGTISLDELVLVFMHK